MILEDTAIKAACKATPPLIEDVDTALVSNCAYSFRVGRVFRSESGEEYAFGPQQSSFVRHAARLGPSEILIIMTKESVHLPDDVMMTYSPLHSLASRGIMLLNASLAEPGYEGPLSCVLVNFGSSPVDFAPDDRIAKAVFFKLDTKPSAPKPRILKTPEYVRQSVEAAGRYHKTFLDIDSVVDKAKKEASGSARHSVLLGGLILAILIGFAQLEPFFTKWLREKPGLASSSTRVEIESKEAELRANRAILEAQKVIDTLQKQLRELEKRQVKSAQKSK